MRLCIPGRDPSLMSRLPRQNFDMSRLSRLKLSARLSSLGLNSDTMRPSNSRHESETSTRDTMKQGYKFHRCAADFSEQKSGPQVCDSCCKTFCYVVSVWRKSSMISSFSRSFFVKRFMSAYVKNVFGCVINKIGDDNFYTNNNAWANFLKQSIFVFLNKQF